MVELNRIFGNGNVRAASPAILRKAEFPVGTTKIDGLSKVEKDTGMYPGLKITQTPGNTGVNESTARSTLEILDIMDAFVVKP